MYLVTTMYLIDIINYCFTYKYRKRILCINVYTGEIRKTLTSIKSHTSCTKWTPIIMFKSSIKIKHCQIKKKVFPVEKFM